MGVISVATESPYLGWPGRPKLSFGNQLALGLYWFPNNILWTGLLLIVFPQRVQSIVGQGHSTGVLSWTTIVGVLVAMIVTPLFGVISDGWRSKYGKRRPLMLIGTVPTVIFLVILAYAPSVPLLLLGLVGIQCFNNVAQSAYQGLIPDLVPHEQRGTASGFMGLYNQLGVVVGGIIAAFAGPILFCWATLAAMLAALLATLGLVKEPSSQAAPRTRLKDQMKTFLVTGEAYRDFRWVFITRLFVMSGLYVLQGYLYYYLEFVMGIKNPATQVFGLLMILSVTALISAMVAGSLSDRLNNRRAIVAAAGILQGICALFFVFTHSLTLIYVAGAIFGLGYGAYQSVDWALVVDTLPGKSAAKDMGIWSISTTGAQLVASLMASLLALFVIPILGTSQSYRILFALTAAFFVAGSLLIWKVRQVA